MAEYEKLSAHQSGSLWLVTGVVRLAQSTHDGPESQVPGGAAGGHFSVFCSRPGHAGDLWLLSFKLTRNSLGWCGSVD